MSAHDYHEGLEGYSPNQLLHDGCHECEGRAHSDEHGLVQLDSHNFARAWHRAAHWQQDGLPDISFAEKPLLRTLVAVQIQLERVTGLKIGALPSSAPF